VPLPVVLDPDRPPGVHLHPHEAAQLVAESWLRELLPGVLVAVDVVLTPRVRALAILELLPPNLVTAGAVVCSGTAAWLLSGGEPPQPLDVIAHRATGGRCGAPLIRLRTRRLAAPDVAEVAGLLVTTPLRTAVDLARELPRDEAVRELCRLAAATGLRSSSVTGYLRGQQPVPGLRTARATIAAWREVERQPTSTVSPGACR
jgi:hypothetical protein